MLIFLFSFSGFFFFSETYGFYLSLHHVKAKRKKTKTKPSILSFCLFALVYQITLASCISWNRGRESWEMEGLSLAVNDLPTSLFLVKAVSFLPILDHLTFNPYESKTSPWPVPENTWWGQEGRGWCPELGSSHGGWGKRMDVRGSLWILSSVFWGWYLWVW